MSDKLTIRQIDHLAAIESHEWQSLHTHDNPFLSWHFLDNLERHVDLESHGWKPAHLLAYQGETLLAAIPLYEKLNSHGEFVFDWMIADAYHQSGLSYYPKYLSAIPFTPVVGARILFHKDLTTDHDSIISALLEYILERCAERQISSVNFLFSSEPSQSLLLQHSFLPRHTWQYHWKNNSYKDFEDFLSRLTSKRRKQIRRERKSIQQQEIQIDILQGNEIDTHEWSIFYDFYCSTFERKWGEPRFTLDFFISLAESMPDSTVLFMASKSKQRIAGAFTMRSKDTLYGRHWGCRGLHRNLHFELCYYQTINYCIEHHLSCLDAGVQGEHKLMRGFMPVRTTSLHWFQRPEYHTAIKRYFQQETAQINTQLSTLAHHNAYNSNIDN